MVLLPTSRKPFPPPHGTNPSQATGSATSNPPSCTTQTLILVPTSYPPTSPPRHPPAPPSSSNQSQPPTPPPGTPTSTSSTSASPSPAAARTPCAPPWTPSPPSSNQAAGSSCSRRIIRGPTSMRARRCGMRFGWLRSCLRRWAQGVNMRGSWESGWGRGGWRGWGRGCWMCRWGGRIRRRSWRRWGWGVLCRRWRGWWRWRGVSRVFCFLFSVFCFSCFAGKLMGGPRVHCVFWCTMPPNIPCVSLPGSRKPRRDSSRSNDAPGITTSFSTEELDGLVPRVEKELTEVGCFHRIYAVWGRRPLKSTVVWERRVWRTGNSSCMDRGVWIVDQTVHEFL